MELVDALTVTVLGMAVVFSGLLLTALLILSFGWVRALGHRIGTRSDRHSVRDQPGAEVAVHQASGEPIDPEVLSVIATVLEVEQRLYHPGLAGRLTIARRG